MSQHDKVVNLAARRRMITELAAQAVEEIERQSKAADKDLEAINATMKLYGDLQNWVDRAIALGRLHGREQQVIMQMTAAQERLRQNLLKA